MKSEKKYITVVGSSNTDMVVQTMHIPRPGETVLGGQFFMNPGGKGANQAVTVARLGGNVFFIAKLGNDIFGAQSRKAFEEEGINTEFVSFDSELPSGVALISVDEKGENCIVVAPGANASLGNAEIASATNCIVNSEIVLIQLEIPLSTVEEVASIAKQNNIKVVLNPAPACALPDHVLENLFLITPNTTEAEMLTGIKVDGLDSCKKAAHILKQKGVQNVIITLGAAGAFVDSDEFTGIIEGDKVDVVDTTGAGDIFNGALTLSLSQGNGFKDAVTFANAVAGISVTRAGAQASVPFMKELEVKI